MLTDATVTLRASALVRPDGVVAADGLVTAKGGELVEVAWGGAAARAWGAARGVRHSLDGVLAPGFVIAHGHLELAALADRVPGDGGFVPWIGKLLAARAATPREALADAARQAAAGLLARGATTLADIDSLGLVEAALATSPQRVLLLREVLDGAVSARAAAALAGLPRAAQPAAGERSLGLSPHAPHTVSRTLLRALGARRAGRAVQVHWAETPEECAWLADGSGPFAPLLGPSPRTSGLELLAAAGLLDGASLVHGNHPAPGEEELVARAGASVVHCPGTHRFFARPPFPWERYRAAGVPVALGTDSLASNRSLDPLRELALAREAFPWLPLAELYAAATQTAARALGLGGRVGQLAVGAAADCVEFAATAPAAFFDRVTGPGLGITRVWIGGTLAHGPASD